MDTFEVSERLAELEAAFHGLMDRYTILQELMRCEEEIGEQRQRARADIVAIRATSDKRNALLQKVK